MRITLITLFTLYLGLAYSEPVAKGTKIPIPGYSGYFAEYKNEQKLKIDWIVIEVSGAHGRLIGDIKPEFRFKTFVKVVAKKDILFLSVTKTLLDEKYVYKLPLPSFLDIRCEVGDQEKKYVVCSYNFRLLLFDIVHEQEGKIAEVVVPVYQNSQTSYLDNYENSMVQQMRGKHLYSEIYAKNGEIHRYKLWLSSTKEDQKGSTLRYSTGDYPTFPKKEYFKKIDFLKTKWLDKFQKKEFQKGSLKIEATTRFVLQEKLKTKIRYENRFLDSGSGVLRVYKKLVFLEVARETWDSRLERWREKSLGTINIAAGMKLEYSASSKK